MEKKLAQMVLAAQRDIATTGNTYNYTMETVAMLIIEYWHRTPRAGEMHELVAGWRLEQDFASAVALTAWLLAQ